MGFPQIPYTRRIFPPLLPKLGYFAEIERRYLPALLPENRTVPNKGSCAILGIG